MEKYVFTVGGGKNYYYPFSKFGSYTENAKILNHPNLISLVLFTGGEDVDPSVYGHKISKKTWSNPKRDQYEIEIFKNAFDLHTPMVGVCRGAQFLCTMAGGTLFQHINGHSGFHSCETWDGRSFNVSSTHHQMQNPPKHSKILAWASPKLSKIYIGEADEELEQPPFEYECVYYPPINAIGIQHHPEMMHEKEKGYIFAEEIVDQYLKSSPKE